MIIYQRRADFPPAAFSGVWPQALVFDQRFELDRIEASTGVLEPGQALALRLNWSVLADVAANYEFEIDLVNLSTGQQQVLSHRMAPMHGGAPTPQWRRGQQYADDYLLAIPGDLPPGAYRMVVRAFDGDREAEPANRAGATSPAMTGALFSGGAPAQPEMTPAEVEFAEGIRLLGYRLEQASGAPDLSATLYWTTSQEGLAPRTVFIHVFDANGALIGQDDAPPAGGALPMPLWAKDVAVTDMHGLLLAAPAATGALFCVGLYDPASLQRLDILAGDGYAIRDNEACRPLRP